MAGVRKYLEKDKENLRKICLVTSSLPTQTETDRNFLYLMYNDYYSECEGDNCFVFTNDDDEAVGYILCAEDFHAYIAKMKKTYLPKIAYLGNKYATMARGEIMVHRLFKKSYPAHLHIDILPEYQHIGAGSQLVEALKAHLKEKNVRGLMLSAGMGNKKAIAFYKKNNFKKTANIFGSVVMTYKF